MKILMVCLGNICRSPIAEGVLQHLAHKNNLNWVVHSAGTNGLHNGEAPHQHSKSIALQHGVDISQQTSRKITAADFVDYDVIYVMAEDVMADVKRIAGENFNAKKVQYFMSALPNIDFGNNVPDPWFGNKDGFVKVYQLIAETCQAIIQKYK